MTNITQLQLDAIDRVGEWIAKSGIFNCDRAEQGKVIALICFSENRSFSEILRTHELVDGKWRKKAMAALAEFRAKGGKHEWVKTGDEFPTKTEPLQEGILKLTPPDGKEVLYRYSMEDAQKEGLLRPGSRWTKRPGNMLRARCISNGIGMVMPEIYAGDDNGDAEAEPITGLTLSLPAPTSETAGLALVSPKPGLIELPPAKAPQSGQLPAWICPCGQKNAEWASSCGRCNTPKPGTEASKPETDEQAEAKMGLASAPKAEEPPSPKPEPEKPKEKQFSKGPATRPAQTTLPDALVQQVEEAIGEHGIAALKWLLKEGWLEKGQGMDRLTEARAKRIIAQKDSFIRSIQG